jgi:hypothetical protein
MSASFASGMASMHWREVVERQRLVGEGLVAPLVHWRTVAASVQAERVRD